MDRVQLRGMSKNTRATVMEEFESYRPLLFAIAYRMTGVASEAEDIVQDAYLRYRSADSSAIHSLKSYLTTIVTHLCLDYLKSARVEREQYIGDWLPEPVLTGGTKGMFSEIVEQRESLSLAFLMLLETLNPAERAVFLLHEVFDYPFQEIAEILGKSVANCRQIFHRARQNVAERRVRYTPSQEQQDQLLSSFISACVQGDVPALMHLLAQDVISWSDGGGKVRAALRPIYGQSAVARLCIGVTSKFLDLSSLTLTREEINGVPAILIWEGDILTVVATVMATQEGVKGVYTLLNPDKLTYIQKQLRQRQLSA
jgi:RNA polymerase sigma-70 factor (ECF subfamily)